VPGSRTATDWSVEMSITRDHVRPLSVDRMTDWVNGFADG
jgi:hypothetical protein